MIAFVNNYVTVQHRNLILAPGRSAFPLLKLILRDRIARTKPAVNPPQFPWASVGQSLPFSHRPFPSVRNLDISGNEALYSFARNPGAVRDTGLVLAASHSA